MNGSLHIPQVTVRYIATAFTDDLTVMLSNNSLTYDLLNGYFKNTPHNVNIFGKHHCW